MERTVDPDLPALVTKLGPDFRKNYHVHAHWPVIRPTR